jgi:WS/DGAT/MGAT family acyltransferase
MTPLDASFLYMERGGMHMHVAAVSVFDASTRSDRRLPFEAVRARFASRLHLAPRLRQRVLFVPGNVGLPVWADHAAFDLDAHVRREALPSPGGRAQLTDLVADVISRPLDRTRPLWELHVVEGLEDGHVATVLKVHHALMDGLAGMQLAMAIYDLGLDEDPQDTPRPWTPDPEPSSFELVTEAIHERLGHPVRALSQSLDMVRGTGAVGGLDIGGVASGIRGLLDRGARPPSPLDARTGSGRRFAMTETPLQWFKDVKDSLGGTVNDIVLTAMGGALYRFLRGRGQTMRGRSLRVLVPVSVRGTGGATTGNRVAPAFVDVPVGAMSVPRRLAAVRRSTGDLKSSMEAMSVDAIVALGAYAPAGVLAAAARLASRAPWFNVVVSNIPGPQQPLYLAGARLVGAYPAMPLGADAPLSIACSSLAGTMAFGLTGDRDAMPDLEDLAVALDDSFAEISKAAGV